MSVSEQKTHAEIIAEMRYKMGVTCPWQVNGGTCELCPLGHSPHGKDLGKYCSFHKLANELEAAHKRERGDCAKLREALVSVQKKIHYLIGSLNVPNSLVANRMEINGIINAALAAPPRNCDVYNNESCRMAYHLHGDGLMTMQAFADWLFAPATEKEGGAE